MASGKDYDHGHQQAAVFKSYPVKMNCKDQLSSTKARIKPDSLTMHPALEVVFAFPPTSDQVEDTQVSLYQNLVGGPKQPQDFVVVGVNKDRLETSVAAMSHNSKNHKMVQLFGTTEVRLSKLSGAFNVGDDVYVRYPDEKELEEMRTLNEPLSLIVCRKTIAPGSKTIAQLMQEKKQEDDAAIDRDYDASRDGDHNEETVKKFLKEVLEKSIFASSSGSTLTYNLIAAHEYCNSTRKHRNVIDKLSIITYLEKHSAYARHRKLGKAIKPARANAKKLLIFLDP